MKGPLLCGPFSAPDLISSIQLFNHIIKGAVVAVGTVWVTASAWERGVGETRSKMGDADPEGLEGHVGTLVFTLSEMESPWHFEPEL